MTSNTERWTVNVVNPRRKQGEKSLYLRARLRSGGKVVKEFRFSTGSNDRSQADKSRMICEVDLNSGGQRQNPADPTFLFLLDLRIDNLTGDPDFAPNTINTYRACKLAFEKTSIAQIPISQITKSDLHKVSTELRNNKGGKPRKPSTVTNYMRQAAAVWRWAKNEEGLISIPWPKPVFKRRKQALRTNKRPFMDIEVVNILSWVGQHRKRWLPLFQLLAGTGARINAVLSLRGKDIQLGSPTTVTFRTQWDRRGGGGWRPLKTGESRKISIPDDFARNLPRVTPEKLLFPNMKDRRRPARSESVRDILRKSFKALRIKDPENLDIHSFRRAWVTTATRAGVPTGVAMKITGHKETQVFMSYQKNAVCDDIGAAINQVHEARKNAKREVENNLPQASPKLEGEPLCYADPTGLQLLTLKSASITSSLSALPPASPAGGGAPAPAAAAAAWASGPMFLYISSAMA